MKQIFKNRYLIVSCKNRWKDMRDSHIIFSINIRLLGFPIRLTIAKGGIWIDLLFVAFGISSNKTIQESCGLGYKFNDWEICFDNDWENMRFNRTTGINIILFGKYIFGASIYPYVDHDNHRTCARVEFYILGFKIEFGLLRSIMRQKTLEIICSKTHGDIWHLKSSPIKLSVSNGLQDNLMCLLRAPDVPDIWNGKLDDYNPRHMFMNIVRISIIERIRWLSSGNHTFDKPDKNRGFGMCPITDQAKDDLIDFANAMESKPLWWYNWFKHVESGFVAFRRIRPDRIGEIDDLFEFLTSLDALFEEKDK